MGDSMELDILAARLAADDPELAGPLEDLVAKARAAGQEGALLPLLKIAENQPRERRRLALANISSVTLDARRIEEVEAELRARHPFLPLFWRPSRLRIFVMMQQMPALRRAVIFGYVFALIVIGAGVYVASR